MFRHPNLNNNNGAQYDFQKKIEQSIRYFKVPDAQDKEDVLNGLMRKIAEQEEPAVQKTKVRKLIYSVSSVAAVGLILFALYFFFAFETYTGSQQASNVFYLPDNSRVVLTDGASLKYSKINYNRNVKLKGEAYFEVKSGDGFFVDTREGDVMVLGTRFRVSDMKKRLHVQCYEGAVGVHYATERVKISRGMLLEGFEQEVNVTEGKGYGYPDFARFNFSCKNKDLNEIWPEIEKYFGVDINYTHPDCQSFTGSISAGNVNHVLDIICTSMKLEYTINENNQVEITPRS
ncbi:MAG: FecR family protein [Prolixibacteraceae bacterium]|jgi:transmembrane sensor|nr:FecR family protein [Prolixibacteraceae bacterium]